MSEKIVTALLAIATPIVSFTILNNTINSNQEYVKKEIGWKRIAQDDDLCRILLDLKAFNMPYEDQSDYFSSIGNLIEEFLVFLDQAIETVAKNNRNFKKYINIPYELYWRKRAILSLMHEWITDFKEGKHTYHQKQSFIQRMKNIDEGTLIDSRFYTIKQFSELLKQLNKCIMEYYNQVSKEVLYS